MFYFPSKGRASLCVPENSSVLISIRQSGFSLIELLISMLIFSVSMLGLASLQITSMRMAQDAQQNYLASLFAGGIASQLKVSSGFPDTSFWQQQVSESLPSGLVIIEANSQGYRVMIRWSPSQDQVQIQGVDNFEYVLDVVR